MNLDHIPSRELHLVLLRRKIAREDAALAAAETGLQIRRIKQLNRMRELGIQETLRTRTDAERIIRETVARINH